MTTLLNSVAARLRMHITQRVAVLLAGAALATGAFTGCGGVQDPAAEPNSCEAGQTACSGWCVDLNANTTSCGSCGIACQVGQSCTSGACTCQAGLTACTSGCSNVLGDGNNCGACGVVCGDGTVCSQGACGTTCAAGTTQCGNSCADLMADVLNCGDCGTVCGDGTTCQAGACVCPAGQTCDQGTPIGTGGVAGVGGSGSGGAGTGEAGTGGAGTGGAGTGGAGTGGAGTGGGGGDEPFGGYVTAFDWKGYTFTSTFGTATIDPEDFSEITGFPLCATGTVAATTGTGASTMTHGAMVGWSVNQDTADGAPALTVMPTLDGIAYDISNAGTTGLRLQIQGPDGATDASDRWCADIGSGGTGVVAWGDFYTECWAGAANPVQYANEPISQVLVMVPSSSTATSFDFCVNTLSPSDADGNQGGEGCDAGSSVSGPSSGTMAVSGTVDSRYLRSSVNTGTPQYLVQINQFNDAVSSGLNYSLSYSGNSFEILTQSGNAATDGAPIAYPSLFIGSAGGNGAATRGSNLAKQVRLLTNVKTAWEWTAPPSGGQYNAAYDVWFSTTNGDSGVNTRSFLMVWFDRTQGVLAEGEGEGHVGQNFSINGHTFKAYISQQFEKRPIISYVPTAPIHSWSFDLNDFIVNAKTQTSSGNNGNPAINDNLYLTNIFAGFEIWNGSVGLKTNGFCAEVE